MGMMLKPVEIQDDSRKKEKANCNYCVRGVQNEISLFKMVRFKRK